MFGLPPFEGVLDGAALGRRADLAEVRLLLGAGLEGLLLLDAVLVGAAADARPALAGVGRLRPGVLVEPDGRGGLRRAVAADGVAGLDGAVEAGGDVRGDVVGVCHGVSFRTLICTDAGASVPLGHASPGTIPVPCPFSSF